MSQFAIDRPGRGESVGQWAVAILVGLMMSAVTVTAWVVLVKNFLLVPTHSGWDAVVFGLAVLVNVAIAAAIVVLNGWAWVYASRLRAREADKKG